MKTKKNKEKNTKKYKRYYDNDHKDGFNNDIGSDAAESNEESYNFDDDDDDDDDNDNNANYEKNPIKQTRNKN